MEINNTSSGVFIYLHDNENLHTCLMSQTLASFFVKCKGVGFCTSFGSCIAYASSIQSYTMILLFSLLFNQSLCLWIQP